MLATSPATQVTLDGHPLPIKKLKGTHPVDSLDLSGKELGVASAIVISSLIADNASLTRLDARGNFLGSEGKAVLQEAVKDKLGFKLEL